MEPAALAGPAALVGPAALRVPARERVMARRAATPMSVRVDIAAAANAHRPVAQVVVQVLHVAMANALIFTIDATPRKTVMTVPTR